jgi:hypothetical protein
LNDFRKWPIAEMALMSDVGSATERRWRAAGQPDFPSGVLSEGQWRSPDTGEFPEDCKAHLKMLRRVNDSTKDALRKQRQALARRRRQKAKYQRDKAGIAVVRVTVTPHAIEAIKAAGYRDDDLGLAISRMLDDL